VRRRVEPEAGDRLDVSLDTQSHGASDTRLLLSFGLWIQSLFFVLWVLLLVAPAWLAFLKLYEERELEIRFGAP